jgi:hypothetical protein
MNTIGLTGGNLAMSQQEAVHGQVMDGQSKFAAGGTCTFFSGLYQRRTL